jgi:predicted dehydrogenase
MTAAAHTQGMKIGIVGPADRAPAWEDLLRPHPSVSEVIIADKLAKIGIVKGCILIDDSEKRLDSLLKSIKAGIHTFFISPLPIDVDNARQIHQTAEEAGVHVLFAHWPTHAPASHWIAQQIENPSFIQVHRNITYSHFIEKELSFSKLWIDELAYCLKAIGGTVQQMNVHVEALRAHIPRALHIEMQFGSGPLATLFVNTCAPEAVHTRLISDSNFILHCDVQEQHIRAAREDKDGRLNFEHKSFDPTLAAENAVSLFLKSIMLRKPTPYNSWDLLRLAKVVKRIEARM